MPELKHDFSQAKMNKDLDERIVPQGQYRDALNIQVATSDGSNVGSAQTLLGNVEHNEMFANNGVLATNSTASVVAVVNKPETDDIFYFVSDGDKNNAAGTPNIRKDYIIKYNTESERNTYVFVDIFSAKTTTSVASSSSTTVVIPNLSVSTYNATGVRVGMHITTSSISFDDNITVTNIAYDSGNNRWNVTVSEAVTIGSGDDVTFRANRVLNFSKHRLITGVNVLDDFLFWTDNFSEPKKINIERSILGTGGDRHLNGAGITGISSGTPNNNTFTGNTPYFHTRLVTSETGVKKIVTNTAVTVPVYVEEKHITVIRKAPTQPLTLKMFRSSDGDDRTTSSGDENPTTCTTLSTFSFGSITPGSTFNITGTNALSVPMDFRVGDKLYFIDPDAEDSDDNFSSAGFDIQQAMVIAEVVDSLVTDPDNLFSTGFELDIISVSSSYTASQNVWNVRRADGEVLFEREFVRFSYRYKYEDGEYSPFAPFSEVAFLADNYEYLPKKGFNLGMLNQLRSLKLTDYYHKDGTRPEDVVEIDLLLKKTNNPTVYTIKTIKPTDEHPIWPDFATDANARGEYKVTTDMVHAVVPSNQLIRPYDNVPRQALAQEITANRLVYANYLQNFTVEKDPLFRLSLYSTDIPTDESNSPSVKSIRKYQIGVVYSDEYGRETPVLTSKDAVIEVPKDRCITRNRLLCRLSSTTEFPDWVKYISYYVKETSSEYYSMAMDRWYEAADGNIWLSFPSSERNKMDEETFLLLKKAHGSDQAVTEKARYKILAIENEAPDHIKTEKKSLGTFFDDGSSVGNNTRGYPLQDTTFVLLDASAFDDVFGDDMITSQYDYDKIVMKLYGQGQQSKEYEVTKITAIGSPISSYKLKIRGKFEDDAAFVSSNDTYDGRINDLSIELVAHEIENKPEFDGRFFVKIYRDEILEQYVLNTNIEEDYFVRASWGLRYLNNDAYANIPASGMIPFDAVESTATNVNGSNLPHPTQYSHFSSYNWGDDSSAAADLINPIGEKHAAALNDDTQYNFVNQVGDMPYRARRFWINMAGKQDFFIDAATAYSWTAKNHDSCLFDRPGNDYANDPEAIWTNGGFAMAPGCALRTNRDDGAPNEKTSNCRPGKGQPSRGIWQSGTRMDISWTGMGEGYDGGNWGDRPFAHRITDVNGGVYEQASRFIAAFVAPGTKFRFQRDPDETVYTVGDHSTDSMGWNNNNIWDGATQLTGAWGIRNYKNSGLDPFNNNKEQYEGACLRQRWTVRVNPAIGSGPSGYNPITGTVSGADTSVRALRHDGADQDVIELLAPFTDNDGRGRFTDNPAIWETEPKESVDVDIYYQAGNLIPIELTDETNEEFLPIGSYFYLADSAGTETKHTITNWTSKDTFTFTPTIAANTTVTDDQHIHFYKRNNYRVGTQTRLSGSVTSGTSLTIHGAIDSPNDKKLYSYHHDLDWSNCFVFGNGAESDRIRDDFNEQQFDNGVKASTVLAERIEEERRKNGLIYSGIYNSNSGVNDTNQFIAGEAITKDIEPSFGSIQKLHTRNTNLLTLCEDKTVKILADKDALFNADGNTNVTATNKVLGAADAYKGNYGISTNPESFVATPYQIYFADPVRGQICALSGEGVRSISDLGMKDYFADLLKDHVYKVIGSYDAKKKEYNITVQEKYSKQQIKPTSTTISYNETTKGWVSFKSFAKEMGTSLNNHYYTFKDGSIWKHHENEVRNNFYGTQYNSTVELLFNDNSTAVKSFGAINYEGTQAKVPQFTTTSHANTWNGDQSDSGGTDTTNFTDGEYYNLTASPGWYVSSGVVTDLQKGGPIYFKDKEGKWFGKIVGSDQGIDNLDDTWKLKDFSSQGIGMATITHSEPEYGAKGRYTIKNNTSTSYEGDDGSGGAWDSTADSLVDIAYSVNTATLSTQVGVATGTPIVNLTITNIVNGVYSGYPLSASEFSCPNFDSEVSGVVFTDNGVAGDPANTINVAVTFNNHTPTLSNYNQDIFIDIDSSVKHRADVSDRQVCFKTIITQATNSTVTIVDVANITESTVTAGSTKTTTHSGTTNEAPTTIAQITITADSGYFIDGNNVSTNFLNLGNYFGNYTVAGVTNTNSNGLATSMTYTVTYNPPVSGDIAVDPPNFCELNHQLRFSYKVNAIETAPTNTVTGFVSNKDLTSTPKDVALTVKGIKDTEYTLKVQKTTGLNSDTVAASNGYYNFTTRSFQTASTTVSGTIDANGENEHRLMLDYASADTRYDVIIAAAGDPASTLHSSVPTAAGDHSIIHRGARTLTIGPSGSAEFYGTLPSDVSISRPYNATKESYGGRSYTCFTTGFTQVRGASKGASSTTRLILDDSSKSTRIKQGMLVLADGVDVGTYVSKINDKYITLSAASTVASGTNIQFITNNSKVKTFSFTITPNSNTLTVNTSNTVASAFDKSFGIPAEITKKVNGAVSSGRTITLDDVNGLVADLTVTGTNIAASTTISSIDETNKQITLNRDVTGAIADDADLVITGGVGDGVDLLYTNIAKVGSNIVIQGAVSVINIEHTVDVNINIDNLINRS